MGWVYRFVSYHDTSSGGSINDIFFMLDFALRDNVLEVAVGLMIAAAFTTLVNSFVSDLLLPPISLLPFMSHRNLPQKFVVLKRGENGTHYNTLQQAQDDGAVTMNYGYVLPVFVGVPCRSTRALRIFLDHLVNFVGLGVVLYSVAQFYSFVSKDSIIKHTVRCYACRKEISAKVSTMPLARSEYY